MALEDAIQNLADALNRYTDTITPPVISGDVALKKSATNVKMTEAAVSATKAADTEVSDTKKASASTVSVEQATTTESVENAEKTTSLSSDTTKPEFDLKDLQDKFAKLIEEDLDKAKEVLTELGFPKLKLVPANLHVKALALTEAALHG